MTVGTSCSKWPIILIAKRSQNVAGSCSEAETPGTESPWKTHPDGMPEESNSRLE